MGKISVVIPVYNSETAINELYCRLSSVLQSFGRAYEIIMVDDGSRDGSYIKMKGLNETDGRVKIIRLARNFGQQNALMCGLRHSTGDYVITMDDDLQNPPEEIGKLLGKLGEGYDVVYGIPFDKRHPFYRNVGTLMTELLFRVLLNKPADVRVSSFRILKRGLVERIIQDKTPFVYISAITFKSAVKVGNVSVAHERRRQGRSNYNPVKLSKLFFKLVLYYSEATGRFMKSALPQYEISDAKM